MMLHPSRCIRIPAHSTAEEMQSNGFGAAKSGCTVYKERISNDDGIRRQLHADERASQIGPVEPLTTYIFSAVNGSFINDLIAFVILQITLVMQIQLNRSDRWK